MLLPGPVRAQDFTFTTNAGAITIADYTGPGGAVTIPDRINGLPVEVIGSSAFSNKSSLTSVTIPDSVTTVEAFAFSSCNNLTNVSFGRSVTDIQSFTFGSCPRLSSVAIPESVTNIGSSTFLWCAGLTNFAVAPANASYSSIDGVVFNKAQTTLILCPEGRAGTYSVPETVATIGDSAFAYCSSLTEVTIADSVTSIDDHAFDGCANLSSVTIGNGVASIGSFAFYNSASLTNFGVATANTNYSSLDGVLFDKSGTTLTLCPEGRAGDYKIPNGVTSIAGSAFYSCARLTSVEISDGVTAIGDSAFVDCTGLTNVAIGTGLATIGGAAFNNCRDLTNISVDAANPDYSGANGILFDKVRTSLILCPGGRAGDYSIPEGVTNVGDYAFSFCTGLTNISFPDSITSVGNEAFYSCTGLHSVTIGKNVTSIGDSAFFGCDSLNGVTVPDSVVTIGFSAFAYCRSLTNVRIGSGVTNIEKSAFDSQTSLTNITVDASNPSFSSVDGVLFDKSQTTLLACPAGRMGHYAIPDGVTTIGWSALRNCWLLSNVNIPPGVIRIGDYAFDSCRGLTSVTIPASVTSIGYQLFYYCWGLTNVYFAGDSPNFSDTLTFDHADNVTVYYLPGTTGWGPTLAGRPTVLWNPTPRNTGPSNPFGFTITGTSNLVIVVEAATDLSTPDWTPVSTNTLTDGSSLFSDPEAANQPARFYRLRSP